MYVYNMCTNGVHFNREKSMFLDVKMYYPNFKNRSSNGIDLIKLYIILSEDQINEMMDQEDASYFFTARIPTFQYEEEKINW